MADLAKIEGDEIVIRVPIRALVEVVRNEWAGPDKHFAVIDLPGLAAEVVCCLNEEDEVGRSILDAAVSSAIGLGSDFVVVAEGTYHG